MFTFGSDSLGAYARDTAWTPPYVADELRDADITEDTYRADAVLAWHRADATPDEAERAGALRDAGEYGALAQEVGAYREALTEVAEARRRWHAATELDRQWALIADAELHRRHPKAELPPLHPRGEPAGSAARGTSGSVSADQEMRPSAVADATADAAASRHHCEPDAKPAGAGRGMDQAEPDPAGTPGAARRDIRAALEAARTAEKIIAIREQPAGRDDRLARDDLVRRREAEAQHEASARASSVRQDPAPSHALPALCIERPAE